MFYTKVYGKDSGGDHTLDIIKDIEREKPGKKKKKNRDSGGGH